MPKDEPAASTKSRLPALTGETVAPPLAAPAPEELASVLLATSAAELLASGVGMTLVSIVVFGLLASVAVDVEMLVVKLKVGMVPVVASVAAVVCCEYEVAVHAAKDAEFIQVVSSVTDPDRVAVGTVA